MVMAEDVPDVSADVVPPGESKITFYLLNSPGTFLSSSYMGRTLSGLQRLQCNRLVEPLASPTGFCGGHSF